MTAAELRARLAHALQLQQSQGLSTAAALRIAWGLAPAPSVRPQSGARVRRRVHSRRRQPLPPIRPVAVRLRAAGR